jgi:hypothetical protein
MKPSRIVLGAGLRLLLAFILVFSCFPRPEAASPAPATPLFTTEALEVSANFFTIALKSRPAATVRRWGRTVKHIHARVPRKALYAGTAAVIVLGLGISLFVLGPVLGISFLGAWLAFGLLPFLTVSQPDQGPNHLYEARREGWNTISLAWTDEFLQDISTYRTVAVHVTRFLASPTAIVEHLHLYATADSFTSSKWIALRYRLYFYWDADHRRIVLLKLKPAHITKKRGVMDKTFAGQVIEDATRIKESDVVPSALPSGLAKFWTLSSEVGVSFPGTLRWMAAHALQLQPLILAQQERLEHASALPDVELASFSLSGVSVEELDTFRQEWNEVAELSAPAISEWLESRCRQENLSLDAPEVQTLRDFLEWSRTLAQGRQFPKYRQLLQGLKGMELGEPTLIGLEHLLLNERSPSLETLVNDTIQKEADAYLSAAIHAGDVETTSLALHILHDDIDHWLVHWDKGSEWGEALKSHLDREFMRWLREKMEPAFSKAEVNVIQIRSLNDVVAQKDLLSMALADTLDHWVATQSVAESSIPVLDHFRHSLHHVRELLHPFLMEEALVQTNDHATEHIDQLYRIQISNLFESGIPSAISFSAEENYSAWHALILAKLTDRTFTRLKLFANDYEHFKDRAAKIRAQVVRWEAHLPAMHTDLDDLLRQIDDLVQTLNASIEADKKEEKENFLEVAHGVVTDYKAVFGGLRDRMQSLSMPNESTFHTTMRQELQSMYAAQLAQVEQYKTAEITRDEIVALNNSGVSLRKKTSQVIANVSVALVKNRHGMSTHKRSVLEKFLSVLMGVYAELCYAAAAYSTLMARSHLLTKAIKRKKDNVTDGAYASRDSAFPLDLIADLRQAVRDLANSFQLDPLALVFRNGYLDLIKAFDALPFDDPDLLKRINPFFQWVEHLGAWVYSERLHGKFWFEDHTNLHYRIRDLAERITEELTVDQQIDWDQVFDLPSRGPRLVAKPVRAGA